MTVKERIRQLVDTLPDDLPETAAAETEDVLGRYLAARDQGRRPRTIAERKAALRDLLAYLDSLPTSEYLLTDEDVSREALYAGRA